MKKLSLILLVCLMAFTSVTKAQALTAFNNVVKNYLNVKNGLVTDNAATAKKAAANMLTALSSVADKDMDAATRKNWLAYSEKLSFDTRHISESDDINHQREHFATLSTNILAALKTFKSNSAILYKQYCPMKKKYWLSETSAIKNPYYGSKMINCGETKETFQANK